jgi:CheY-like chemotaxis protein
MGKTKKGSPMPNPIRQQILVVDDDASVRTTLTMLLQASGYEVTTAANGAEALMLMQSGLPAVLLSDLNMPVMSGFELLSVVRQKFPKLPVVAMSGAYETGDAIPGGVIADAFYAKGYGNPGVLLRILSEMTSAPAEPSVNNPRQTAPVWIPRNGKGSAGIAYVMVTCPGCLKSFPLDVKKEYVAQVQETTCLFCTEIVRYMIDFSLITSPDAAKQAYYREPKAASSGA